VHFGDLIDRVFERVSGFERKVEFEQLLDRHIVRDADHQIKEVAKGIGDGAGGGKEDGDDHEANELAYDGQARHVDVSVEEWRENVLQRAVDTVLVPPINEPEEGDQE